MLPSFLLMRLINIMERQALLSQMQLRSLQLVQQSPSAQKAFPSQRPPNSTRTLMKLYLTREILEECLQSLDIFRDLLDDPIQRHKLLRDVTKNLQLNLYDEGAIVYSKGDLALSLYMVIRGKVSLRMPAEGEEAEHEIDLFGQGVGFGEAEFVHGRKRALLAVAVEANTVVGVLDAGAFQEVIQLYRQRVYLRKIDMFSNCPLFSELQPFQLEFIVNNAKPATFSIDKELAREKELPKVVFLITEGTVQLRSTNPPSVSPQFSKYRTNSKCKLPQILNEKIKIKKLVMGVLQEGEFLGDFQLALRLPYAVTAVATSAKVRAYACDERIILSQLTQDNITTAANYYKSKQRYRQQKPQAYHKAKNMIQRRLEREEPAHLSPSLQRAKRIIAARYVEPQPSFVGKLSPKEIVRIIERKCARAHSHTEGGLNELPMLNVLPPAKRLVPDQRSYSPLLKKERTLQHQRRNIEQTPTSNHEPNASHKRSQQHYLFETLQSNDQRRSESPAMLVFMKPFTKKVLSLHERLINQYGHSHKREGREGNFSMIEIRRVRRYADRLKTVMP